MAGSVSIIQPSKGHTSAIGTDPSYYRVQWDSMGSTAIFRGFRIVCEACGETLYTFTSNPSAPFDINDPPNTSGGHHPGPYSIYTDVGNPSKSYTATARTSGGAGVARITGRGGTVISASERDWDDIPDGGSVTVELEAVPDEGYVFKEWRLGDPNTGDVLSKRAKFSKSWTLSGSYTSIHDYYYAVFVSASAIPVVVLMSGPITYDRLTTVGPDQVRYRGPVDGSTSATCLFQVLKMASTTGGVYTQKIDTLDVVTTPAFQGSRSAVILPGQTLSITFRVLDVNLSGLFGFSVDHMEVREKYATGDVVTTDYAPRPVISGNHSWTHTVAGDLDGGMSCLVTVIVYVVSAIQYRRVTLCVVGDPLCVPYLYVDKHSRNGVQPSYRWNSATRRAAPGEHCVSMSVPVIPSGYSSGDVDGRRVEFGGFPVRDNAFVHGWSVPVSQVSGVYCLYVYDDSSADIYVTAFVCTHLLVCKEGSGDLEGKRLAYSQSSPQRLIYDCSVPTGTTVYP